MSGSSAMAPHHLLVSMLLGLAGLALLAGVAAGAKLPDEAEEEEEEKNQMRVNHGKFAPGPWTVGHATFYGGRDGSGTKEGACGYKDTAAEGFGVQTAAVGPSLFSHGAGCGACFELKGVEGPLAGKTTVVTATNEGPPAVSGKQGEHFDLTMPAFLQIAEEKAGIVPVSYRKVPCVRQGGIRYTITGNKFYNSVMVTNVGGAGDVVELSVKGNKRVKWTPLQRSWGQTWQTGVDLTGESLTFRVMTGDHRKATSWHVMPPDWQFGKTYQAAKNF
ncbi:hypothetical protein ACP70R_023013 [Stipagrostis hirtigluma subsp. patula]